MKLYINTPNGKTRINVVAPTRAALAQRIGSRYFQVGNRYYNVQDVYAEKDAEQTAAGAILGGLLGLIAGPAGVIGGGVLGGLIGNEADVKEKQKIDTFNRS